MSVLNAPKTLRAFYNSKELSRIYLGSDQIWPVVVVTKKVATPFLVPSNELQDYLEDGSEMVPLMAGGPPALVTDGTAIFAVGLQGNVPVKSWGLDRVKSTIIKDIDPNSPEAHYGTYFALTPIHPFKYGTNADDNWTDGSGHAPEFGGIVPPRKYWAQDQIDIQAVTSDSAPTEAVHFIVVIFTLTEASP